MSPASMSITRHSESVDAIDEIYGSILVDKTRISFDDILRIGNADGVFQKDWSTEYPVD